MKVIVIHQYGDQSVLSLGQTETQKPGDSEMMIEEGHVSGKIVLSVNDG
jgi:hypothetical protein